MNIYRLDPIDTGHPSWQYSDEKDCLWACAPTPEEARDLVTAKSGFASHNVAVARSPWQDETVTSCTWDRTLIRLRPGEVIRQDGSLIDRRSKRAAATAR